ncbi:hypothetical protein [Leptolyngbya sp. 7M]|uniref:hypothetical protein n=1 Tax=Leptolyngbya sp. 7M TaxID=2812896 RepID=UPI001B8D2B0E|nr:hypothetical protein [Leptolyngbya sp. 7M]QYO65296.1 hypothetical protein JVX88_00485 [Leptolyngbya sp. 7M]
MHDFIDKLRETLEEPVKQAVLVTCIAERTASSGFHHFHKPPAWGIVFEEVPSRLVKEIGESLGLVFRVRELPEKYWPEHGLLKTDLYLPHVPESEPETAKNVFDEFARRYAKAVEMEPDSYDARFRKAAVKLPYAEEPDYRYYLMHRDYYEKGMNGKIEVVCCELDQAIECAGSKFIVVEYKKGEIETVVFDPQKNAGVGSASEFR